MFLSGCVGVFCGGGERCRICANHLGRFYLVGEEVFLSPEDFYHIRYDVR